MNGRTFRAIVGGAVVLGDVVSFLVDSLSGSTATWQSVVGHAIMMLVGLLLIDHKIGLEVINKVSRKIPRSGRGG